MFNRKKQPAIKSLIAEDSSISGNMTFTHGIRIDGEVNGDVRASEGHASLLVISESAKVQGYQTLRDGSSLKLTIAKWLTPKGRSISEHGITPDTIVEMPKEVAVPMAWSTG